MVASQEAGTVIAPVDLYTFTEAKHAACPDIVFAATVDAFSCVDTSVAEKHQVARSVSLHNAPRAEMGDKSATPVILQAAEAIDSGCPDVAGDTTAGTTVRVSAAEIHLIRKVDPCDSGEPLCATMDETRRIQQVQLSDRNDLPGTEEESQPGVEFLSTDTAERNELPGTGEEGQPGAEVPPTDAPEPSVDPQSCAESPDAALAREIITAVELEESASSGSCSAATGSGMAKEAQDMPAAAEPEESASSGNCSAPTGSGVAKELQARRPTAEVAAAESTPVRRRTEDSWSCMDDDPVPCESHRSTSPSEAGQTQQAWAEVLGQIAYAPDALLQSLARDLVQDMDWPDVWRGGTSPWDDVTSAEGAEESVAATVPLLPERSRSSIGLTSRSQIPVQRPCNLQTSSCKRISQRGFPTLREAERQDMQMAVSIDMAIERACSWDEISLIDEEVDVQKAPSNPPVEEPYSFSCRGISCRDTDHTGKPQTHRTDELHGVICREWTMSTSRPLEEEETEGVCIFQVAESQKANTKPRDGQWL